MTNDEIDKLESGIEMDALIAEKVMGHKLIRTPSLSIKIYEDFDRSKGAITCVPWELNKYSSDILAAWMIVEKLKLDPIEGAYYGKRDFAIHYGAESFSKKTCWRAGYYEAGYDNDFDDSFLTGEGDTAPLAICRAALKIVNSVRRDL